MSEGFSESIEHELDTHGIYVSNTVGASMRPLFRTHRDMVVIKKPDAELKKYDVALYKDDRSRYVLHRVIAMRDDHYVIRGDNTFVKEIVPKDRCIGVLTSFNRKGKRHSVDEAGYKFYSRFWHFIYPLRAVCRKLRVTLAKLYHKVTKDGR